MTTSVRNAERLLHLVDSLLDPQARPPEVSVQDVDLARLIRYSLDSAEVHARRGNPTLASDPPARLTAVPDPVKMGQVVDNLLFNVITYTPDGSTVIVSLRRLSAHPGDDSSGAEAERAAPAGVRDNERANRARSGAVPCLHAYRPTDDRLTVSTASPQ